MFICYKVKKVLNGIRDTQRIYGIVSMNIKTTSQLIPKAEDLLGLSTTKLVSINKMQELVKGILKAEWEEDTLKTG